MKSVVGSASRLFTITAIGVLPSCSDEPGLALEADDLETLMQSLEDESQCGDWDAQDVEEYDGSLGVSQGFVDLHQRPVGFSRFSPIAACTGTLLTRTLYLSAGHCGYTTSDTVVFNYRVNGDTDGQRVT